MFSTDTIYEVVTFAIGDTKSGTKMGKLQLKDSKTGELLNCILWEEALNRMDMKLFRNGNQLKIVSGSFNERYNNCLVSSLELIKEAKKGNTDAFEKIILYYKNDLFKIAKTRLSNIEDIEDAVQETIISVFKSLHKLKNTSKFKSWIFTILINNCNHILKKRKTTSIFPYDFIEKEQYINSNTNYSLNFEDLMNILELDERTILTLYYSENYTSKEISKILKMNDSTVRNKIAKAKKKIESNLKEVENYE